MGIFAFGLASVLNASGPWASATFSITLAMLTVALVGILCRSGERRAFWVGFAICGWLYMVLTTGPWFVDRIGPRLVTTRLLDSRERQSEYHRRDNPIDVRWSRLGGGMTPRDLGAGFRGMRFDVWVRKEGEKAPSLCLEEVQMVGLSPPEKKVRLMMSKSEMARLKQAQDAQMEIILERHHSRPALFAGFWSSLPVSFEDFRDAGHSWLGFLFAWIGGWVGRYFYATRDPESRDARPV